MEESRERGEHSFNDPEQFISVFDLSVTTVFQNCGPCGYIHWTHAFDFQTQRIYTLLNSPCHLLLSASHSDLAKDDE